MDKGLASIDAWLPWGPSEFDWPGLLPELQELVRRRANPRAAALLALTSTIELAASRGAARNFLVTLAYMDESEHALLGFFRDRVRLLGRQARGSLHHAIATVNKRLIGQALFTEAENSRLVATDWAVTRLLAACSYGTRIDICDACEWVPAMAPRWTYHNCAGSRHGDSDCHAPRTITCDGRGCPETGCVEHMHWIACDGPRCANSYIWCTRCIQSENWAVDWVVRDGGYQYCAACAPYFE